MDYRKTTYGLFAGITLLLVSGLAVTACSSDKNTEPTSSEGGSGGVDATGGKSSKGGGSSKGGSSSNEGGSAGSSTEGGSAGSSTDGGAGGAGGSAGSSACVPDTTKNCYSCTPETNTQYLNACNATGDRPGCSAYDNTKLTKLVAGKVPALP